MSCRTDDDNIQIPDLFNHNDYLHGEDTLIGNLDDTNTFPSHGVHMKKDVKININSSTLTTEDDALPETTKSASQTIEETLESMTMQEREAINKGIYGIGNDPFLVNKNNNSNEEDSAISEESPAFIQERLNKMDHELQRLMNAGSIWNVRLAAIELAEAKNVEYVQNATFRLQFLRCEQWDATKAAARFIRYFDYKMELFGEDCLAREVTMEDLSHEDKEMLKVGYMQYLPVRDRAGRAVLCSLYVGQMYESPDSLVRTIQICLFVGQKISKVYFHPSFADTTQYCLFASSPTFKISNKGTSMLLYVVLYE